VKKFLIVGCGGSGGATLRFMMDQLRADLRSRQIQSIPPAWQFLHIDVNPSPDATPGLGTIRDLGGRYASVSSPGNLYALVANNVESALANKQELRSLLGWAPLPKSEANAVNVINGAGQYRGIGRMLTLSGFKGINAELKKSWEELQRPDAWGDLPTRMPEGGPYASTSHVVPIVIGSLAGGSGAAMFLDVCRLLGQLGGLTRSELGVFLYTSDVFGSLDESQRKGIDGNAMGAIGDLIAAQARAADTPDMEILTALGLPPETVDEPPFARVFPIGASIGGDGAKFGDGTMQGVYRGLGRALAAMVGSDSASNQYSKSNFENPTRPTMDRTSLGWGIDPAVFSWGSFGYASLSLGRERYAEYASQRLARNAVDRLLRGYLSGHSQLPADEQLKERVSADWPLIIDRLGLPPAGADVRRWLLSERVLTPATVRSEAQLAISSAMQDLSAIPQSQAGVFVEAARVRLGHYQPEATQRLRNGAYAWAEAWASRLETSIRDEFMRAITAAGLPYAREVVVRLRSHLTPLIEALRGVPAMDAQPLVLDNAVAAQAAALKKTLIGAGHALVDAIGAGYLTSATRGMERESARLSAEVLTSLAHDVLVGLERAADVALVNLEAAERATSGEAGLAQLETTIYSEWPLESELVPSRFDHADNEVLLTTSKDFPARFRSDVAATVMSARGIYDTALHEIVSLIVAGQWETTGGQRGDFPVLTTQVEWRSAALPISAASQQPTPRQAPVYQLATSTADLLDRARAYQRRPDQPFQEFSEQTFGDYLNDPRQPDAEQARRLEEFVQKFNEARMLARPLVGVSPHMIQQMHPGESLTYEYAFGAIPLAPGTPVVVKLTNLLDHDDSLSDATVGHFTDSLSATTRTNRIAIFGSYPKYSPLVFSSFLSQMQRRWAASSEPAKRDLWTWKRSRPLPGALAMGSAELHTLIKGWFLARMLGLLVVPGHTTSQDPVQVFDLATEAWLPFPSRMLTPRDRYRGADDWLPGVLEGHTLALINCTDDVHLAALRPYVALRRIADDSPSEPFVAYDGSSGDRLVVEWLSGGVWPSGHAPEIPSLAGLGSQDPAARASAAREWLAAIREYVAGQYLTDGSGVGALAMKRVRIDTVASLERAPMFAEIAEIVYGVLEELETSVERAAAQWGTIQEEPNVARPTF